MYRNIEIESQQEPPTSCTLDALRRMSNAYFERSPGNAEWARDGWGIDFVLLYGVSMRWIRCEAGARCLAGCTVAKCSHGARARGTRELFVWEFLLRCFVWVVSIASFVWVVSIVSFVYEALWRNVLCEASQTRKKKKKHSYEYFFLDEFDWLNCVEAVQECFCVCDNYAVFCEIFDECF